MVRGMRHFIGGQGTEDMEGWLVEPQISAEERKAIRVYSETILKHPTAVSSIEQGMAEHGLKLLDALEAAEARAEKAESKSKRCNFVMGTESIGGGPYESVVCLLPVGHDGPHKDWTGWLKFKGEADALRDEVERLREAGKRVVTMWKLAGSARFEDYKPGFHARDLSFAMSDLDTALSAENTPYGHTT